MFNNFSPTEEIAPEKEETTLMGERLQIGNGARGVRIDERGLFFKTIAPSDSPLHIDMDGNNYIRASEGGGGNYIWYDDRGNARIFIGFEE